MVYSKEMLTDPTARSWSRAGVSNRVVAILLSFWCLTILQIFAIRLERAHDIQLRLSFARASSDATPVHHETWSVEPSHLDDMSSRSLQ